MSIKVLEFDLSETERLFILDQPYQQCYIVVRYKSQLIGCVLTRLGSNDQCVSSSQIYQAVIEQLSQTVERHLVSNLLWNANTPLTSVRCQPVSVIVCTRDRPVSLAICLEALLNVKYKNFEVIIVDNAPANNETLKIVSGFPFRYIREDRPGLDWARNRGIREAQYDIIAFTDDDACVDAYWLEAISNSFLNAEVMAVTGYVAPAELATASQYVFEFGYGGMGHGLYKRIFRKHNLSNQELIWASGFGVGANMAFRREIFSEIGDFDVALDVGTPSGGGGDIDMFHRIVSNGHVLIYEPSMLVWHKHRAGFSSLRRQIFNNGRSFGCYLIKRLNDRTVSRSAIINFFFVDWLWKWIFKNVISFSGKPPRSLLIIELLGMLTSPLAYKSSQIAAKRCEALTTNDQ